MSAQEPYERRPLRGALFGCGMISEYHLRAWARIPEVQIVALGNRTVEKAERRRREFCPGAAVYGSLTELLERERPDLVDILSAPEAHEEHCRQAAEAGAAVICQKPLAADWDAALRVAEVLSAPGVVAAVHENHRYRPWFRRVLEAHRSGLLGRVRFLRIEHFNATSPAEPYKLTSPTGVWLEYGSHLVDMMRALLGEPTRVLAQGYRVSRSIAGESLVAAQYQLDGATASIEVGWKESALTQGSLLAIGDEGEAWFEGTMTRCGATRFRLVHRQSVVLDETRDAMADYNESFYLLEREFIDALKGAATITQTPAEHLATLRAVFAAYRSMESGTLVPV
ncbi:MAG: Gfo/Idh/MocA family oxidoreductase [Bryobacteraceae bacterium]|nr:Gfo/Idh/MocA family oxidoreductase [Bryobacteraceae bacterium]